MRDHRPPVARAIALDDVLDGVERLTNRGIADGVNVDLQPEIVDAARGVGEGVTFPHLHAVVVQR